ncbi:ABC transporter ATP-binding protein [Methanoregula formicica]|uniref:ABC-type multidrug transport system, ATPase component n=1 Tax=Methanoregula formicica (strain DSM 22288 / NBRC 105244 / SMSP) TaxID=593750 RepID=L0HFU8_METFS|nr:ABC transporter ATP-binding protein [Methanoregula formicica]AGB02168.1 ABC-type multidrug transport system, ATPase component [Methanoregula formicica SMSP]
MTAIIEAHDLKKNYNGTVAVDGIRFTVKQGEIFGFLGPNGAGKTTTMKMITCVSPRSSGSLTILGMDPDDKPAEIKQSLGVVPQETNLDPDFTCFGNLYYYALYFDITKDEATQRAEELLEFVQLTEKRDVSVDKLSGGMKRRLILARALVNRPDLLVLDEPTIGLDPQARHLIWEKLRSLQAKGNTIVMTTHYLDEAARLCDRLVIMDNGKILVEGAPADLVRDHAGHEIVEVEGSDDVVTCLSELGVPFEKTGDMVQVAATSETAREVARTILERCRPERMITRPATLEDVFLKLTGRNLRE